MRFLDATQGKDMLRVSPALAESVASAVARGDAPPTFCLRRQRPYVLLGPQDLRLPHTGQGVQWLEAQGLPVYRRVGGGAAVLLDEGCLSFFAAIPSRDLGRIDENFRSLTLPVRMALEGLGAPSGFGRAPGSYCEGPQDLVTSGGRKIAGVAQALRRGYALVSGMVLVCQDPRAATALLQGFYVRAGSDRSLDPGAVTSLSMELSRPVGLDEVRDAIVRAGEDAWDLEPGPLRAAEAQRAELLLAKRRACAQGVAAG